jgi:hypothetical protein
MRNLFDPISENYSSSDDESSITKSWCGKKRDVQKVNENQRAKKLNRLFTRKIFKEVSSDIFLPNMDNNK